MNKNELIETLEDSRQELFELLDGLPDELMLQPIPPGDWTIKDILAHLVQWEGQTVTLLFQVARGTKKPTTVQFGPESEDELNARWHAASQARPLEMVWQDWVGVRKQLIRRVSEMSAEDLTNPARFSWMKGQPLYQLILSDTVEHEEEHADAIRTWLDQIDAPPPDGGGDNGHHG